MTVQGYSRVGEKMVAQGILNSPDAGGAASILPGFESENAEDEVPVLSPRSQHLFPFSRDVRSPFFTIFLAKGISSDSDDARLRKFLLTLTAIETSGPRTKTKGLKEQIAEELRTPNSTASLVLIEIARQTEAGATSFFNFGLPFLHEVGILGSIKDLEGPLGERLITLAREAKRGLGTVFHWAVRTLLTKQALTKEQLAAALMRDGNWLDGLALASGSAHSKEGWKPFYFGLVTLADLGLITKRNLDDAFRYEEGSMLFEMARSTHTVAYGQDYFGFLLADWLEGKAAADLNSKVVGDFIRGTANPAGQFYAAGERQRKRINKGDTSPRWRDLTRNFRGLLPVDDIPALLGHLTRALDDPLGSSLPTFIEDHLKIHIVRPRDIEDIRFTRTFGEFLETLTQEAGLKEKWFRAKVDLSELTKRYRAASPEKIFDVAMVLNTIVSELGDSWVKNSRFPVPSWAGFGSPIIVPIDITTIQSVYARCYLIRILNPALKNKYKFIWKGNGFHQLTVSNIANFLTAYEQLRNILGDDSGAISLDELDITRMELDLRGLPDTFLTLEGLNNTRMQLNERSASLRYKKGGRILLGDVFVTRLSDIVGSAIIVPNNDPRLKDGQRYVPIGLMVKILHGWSDFDSLRNATHANDIKGNYETIARYIAASVSGYFENRMQDLHLYSGGALRRKLRELGHPLTIDKATKDEGDLLREFLEKVRRKEEKKDGQ